MNTDIVMINASPRTEKNSNTDKIIEAFGQGLLQGGCSFAKYAISQRDAWEDIKGVYLQSTNIIFAVPLYVECVPSLFLEFLEQLPAKDKNTKVSFILQSGFTEAHQLRCGEAFLQKVAGCLGASYGGTLIRGGCFEIRTENEANRAKITAPFIDMGRQFAEKGDFFADSVKKFAGAEQLPLPVRFMVNIMFKTFLKWKFRSVARKWGCDIPLDRKIFEE